MPNDPNTDPFKPPAIPTEVFCLHCQQTYESYLIEWRAETGADGKAGGFWCCPTPGCGGCGFGFDIFPTDPDYRTEDGETMWVDDEDEDGAGDFEDEDDADDVFEDDLPSNGTNGSHHRPKPDGESDIPY
jgi:hypothetical protein